jgi:hypothetical protein
MWPTQFGGRPIRAEVWPTEAREVLHSCSLPPRPKRSAAQESNRLPLLSRSLAVSEDANDARGPLGEARLGEAGGAGIVHGLGVGSPQPDALAELADGEQ